MVLLFGKANWFFFLITHLLALDSFIRQAYSLREVENDNQNERIGNPSTKSNVSFRKNNMRVDARTGAPRAIYGVGFRMDEKNSTTRHDPKDVADMYLAKSTNVLKLDGNGMDHKLKHYTSQKTPAGSTMRYHQEVQGFEVYDHDVIVTVNNRNEVSFVMSDYEPRLAIRNSIPRVTEFAAVDSALQEMNMTRKDMTMLDSKLVIYANNEEPRLAWKILISATTSERTESLEFLYDAITGENIQITNLIISKMGREGIRIGKSRASVGDSSPEYEQNLRNQPQARNLRGYGYTNRRPNKKQKHYGFTNRRPGKNNNTQSTSSAKSTSSTDIVKGESIPISNTDFISDEDRIADNPSTVKPTSSTDIVNNKGPISDHSSPAKPSPAAENSTNIGRKSPFNKSIMWKINSMLDFDLFNCSRADVPGSIFDPNPLASARASYFDEGYRDNNDRNSEKLQAQLKNVTLKDVLLINGEYRLNGPYAHCVDYEAPEDGSFRRSSNLDYRGNRADDFFEASNIYYHIDFYMRYLNEDLGIDVGPRIYKGGVKFDPHGAFKQDNSYYDMLHQRLSFGQGGVDDGEDADVIIHELSHGLHQWLTRDGVSQREGIAEGFGDYVAVSYSRTRNKWKYTDPQYNWVFGWDGHNEFWQGRITNLLGKYPDELIGSIHYDGQIWSTCYMKLWDTIGARKADTLVFTGISYTGKKSTQEDVANAVLAAARDLDYSQEDIFITRYILEGCGYHLTAGHES